MRRVCVVVHPTRDLDQPLATLREWTEEREIELLQLPAGHGTREVAPPGTPDACDLVVAIGGDGTVLAALRAAAESGTPVLGVSCGSLGALTAIAPDDLERALGSFDAGDWLRRDLPALEITCEGEPLAWALNDFALVRRAGQLVVDVTAGGELYARMAGDGVVAATPLGSSAYSMAAGGPILAAGTNAFVVTPTMIHGGSRPPLVVPAGLTVEIEAHPTWSGFDVEVDGQRTEVEGTRFTVALAGARATLVALEEPGPGLAALRRRGLVTDSPRVLARDKREGTPARS